MKKLFAYKGTVQAAKSIHNAAETAEKYVAFLEKVAKAIVMVPVNAQVKYLEFRLRMTDKSLEAKAKSCERILKEMSVQRKKLAKEQYEARQELKAVRIRFNYPGNHRTIKD